MSVFEEICASRRHELEQKFFAGRDFAGMSRGELEGRVAFLERVLIGIAAEWQGDYLCDGECGAIAVAILGMPEEDNEASWGVDWADDNHAWLRGSTETT